MKKKILKLKLIFGVEMEVMGKKVEIQVVQEHLEFSISSQIQYKSIIYLTIYK